MFAFVPFKVLYISADNMPTNRKIIKYISILRVNSRTKCINDLFHLVRIRSECRDIEVLYVF